MVVKSKGFVFSDLVPLLTLLHLAICYLVSISLRIFVNQKGMIPPIL